MENASKALIMAGTVLISILLISILVLFFRKGASASAEYNSAMSDAELAKFNAKFEVYDRNNNTYFDMITVANMVYDVNRNNKNDSQNQILFTLNLSGITFYIPRDCTNLERDTFTLGLNGSDPQSMYNYKITYDSQTDKIINIFTKIDPDTKKYKYIFKCTGITYSTVTGKVSSIEFEVIKNT